MLTVAHFAKTSISEYIYTHITPLRMKLEGTGLLLKDIRIPICFVTFSRVTDHVKTWMSVLSNIYLSAITKRERERKDS